MHRRRSGSQRSAVRSNKDEVRFRVASHGPATFVEQTVVKAAQLDQVANIRGTSLSPVIHVVIVGEAGSLATREAAAAVSVVDLAVEPGRHLASRTSHSERATELVVVDECDPAITGETPEGFRCDGVITLDLCGPVSREHDRFGVDHDGGSVSVSVGCDGGGGKVDQGVRGGLLEGPVQATRVLGLRRGSAADRFLDNHSQIRGKWPEIHSVVRSRLHDNLRWRRR